MDTGELRLKWGIWRSAPWWPAVLLVLVQTLNGMWYMPQLSFFPVYLQELGLPPATIGGVVAGAQLAGMAVALFGGWVAATRQQVGAGVRPGAVRRGQPGIPGPHALVVAGVVHRRCGAGVDHGRQRQLPDSG